MVLSSCNSARGRNVPGEGAMGFTRAFLHSGARAVVATLWKVDDEASARFFELFYKALFVQGAVPSAALRTAQQGLRADSRWSSPDFWAAFVIAGVD